VERAAYALLAVTVQVTIFRLLCVSMFLLACTILSAWTWYHFLVWLAADMKCPPQ